jgi:hypothetical protein
MQQMTPRSVSYIIGLNDETSVFIGGVLNEADTARATVPIASSNTMINEQKIERDWQQRGPGII